MTLYRDRDTGDLKSQDTLRKENKNISFPKIWDDNVLNVLKVDEVLESDPPTEGIGAYQYTKQNGVTKNSDGKWVKAWEIVDLFADIEGGQTKAEQEAVHQKSLDESAAATNREDRNAMLRDTDWWAMSDTPTMTSEQTAYRQALRDLPSHSNWPHLEDSDWPTKPE
jgi:hypothetical protein|tara:strand:+ start:3416 stop:3916 length:501 start_codon:yes stop_codon:yes gene_type:complete